MNHKSTISAAIRDALDMRGIEITWSDTDAAADKVMDALESVFESAWMYDDLANS